MTRHPSFVLSKDRNWIERSNLLFWPWWHFDPSPYEWEMKKNITGVALVARSINAKCFHIGKQLVLLLPLPYMCVWVFICNVELKSSWSKSVYKIWPNKHQILKDNPFLLWPRSFWTPTPNLILNFGILNFSSHFTGCLVHSHSIVNTFVLRVEKKIWRP